VRALPFILLLACARPAPIAAIPAPRALVLERVLPVSGPGDFQPSGLVFRDGRLYTVSDKSSSALLELRLTGDAASAVPAIPIRPPEGPREDLDLEGIALDPSGDFLLVSEARGQVLLVPATGGPARWLPADFAAAARSAGLLVTPGAGFEGIAALGDRLVLAAERQPRGLVVASGARLDAWRMDRTTVPLPAGRVPDFADLATAQGRLFGLVRNGDAVVELAPAGARFVEARWWSFASIAAEHRYRGQQFGLGEGLAIAGQQVYVILDNNGAARVDAPADHRPRLFVLHFPDR
jgi:hypothetical protein